jgi:hypothetical protein
MMSIKNLLSQYKEKKDSGLLSVKVEGNEYLLKIYFELGMVVGLSIGTLKNEDCFDVLGNCRPMEASFIKGYRTPDFAANHKEEINDRLDGFLATYPVISSITAGNGQPAEKIPSQDIHKLETAFIDLIGPLGKMIIETAYSDIGYRRGADMLPREYSRLIDKLQEALPPEHRSSFAAKYAMGLALE